jgi:anthraniloyl-CoA monooxygenase
MQVTTIGGGPGGLYASLLLARTHPEWEITVHERNPQGVTYGWGIVLPGRTLPNLEAADPSSHAAIAETVEQWEPFDIYYGGDRFRFDGNEFNSMMRAALLELLQERCRAVGVDLAFESEITDPRSAAAEADLVIAADGIHSQTRATFAEQFGTEVVEGEARFAWFGTDSDFEALSHIFVKNEDGLWCAHTYPGPTSTFIIDCDVETWERSGVAEMDESAYLDYFEGVFEGYLDGEGLLSQRDRWMTFTTVRNDSWHHDNVVLVGDAAHTAHYSIGSGTTLALEDGIALMETVEAHGADVDRALRAYETTRKPAAEALQLAGERSRVHFEDIRRFERLDPTQFAFHHVTRSGRLTYGSLSRRAPEFVGAFDEWFAEHAAPGDQPVREPASQPAQVGPTTLRNRLVSPVGPARSAVDGLPGDGHLATVSAAGTAPGMVLTDPVAVSTAGRPTAGSPGLYDDAHEAAWRGAVERLHRHETDVAAGVHLTHAGPAAARDARPVSDGETGRADAWAPPVDRVFSARPRDFAPDRLTADRRATVRDAFRSATERARRVGFDHLQLYAGFDSLLLSSLRERRDPSLGFAGEILDAVRATWPGDRSLGVTLGVGAGGVALDGAFEITRALAAEGVDVVAPVAGAPGEADPAAGSYGPAGYSDNVRNETGVPTLAVAHVTSVDRANTLVGTGRADLCAYYGPAPE